MNFFLIFFLTFAIPAAPGENPPSVSLPLPPRSRFESRHIFGAEAADFWYQKGAERPLLGNQKPQISPLLVAHQRPRYLHSFSRPRFNFWGFFSRAKNPVFYGFRGAERSRSASGLGMKGSRRGFQAHSRGFCGILQSDSRSHVRSIPGAPRPWSRRHFGAKSMEIRVFYPF